MKYEFRGKVYRWPANPAFFLVEVPKKYFKEISEVGEVNRRGWGSVRVHALIGRTSFTTSIFPDAAIQTYALPLKKSVRVAEKFEDGSTVFVQLELVDF
ncbi:MAG: DUF1905 domain-containing protein [Micrococcales bacterium]